MTAGSVRYQDLESGSCLEGLRHALCFFPVERQKECSMARIPYYLKIYARSHSYSGHVRRGNMQYCIFPLWLALVLSSNRAEHGNP